MEFNWAQALNVLDTAWKECDKEPKDENFDIKKNNSLVFKASMTWKAASVLSAVLSRWRTVSGFLSGNYHSHDDPLISTYNIIIIYALIPAIQKAETEGFQAYKLRRLLLSEILYQNKKK